MDPEYSTLGMLPSHLFIDDMIKDLNKKYNVDLFSAASLHSAETLAAYGIICDNRKRPLLVATINSKN